uniref:Uncharacterized protein n=1 Tax=Myoviridae sp. ctUX613 TaxID=2826660 RepID=A0A8S5N9M7_9CAUD|nr:MAG TPA: hypothetical protein [Myoviridae sp. ctUX613]
MQKPTSTSPQGTHFWAVFPEKQPQNALTVEKTVHNPPILPVRFQLPPVQRRLRPVQTTTSPRAVPAFPPLPFFPLSFTSILTFLETINFLFPIFLTFSHPTFFSRFPLIDILRYTTAPDRFAGLRGGMLQYS